MRKFLFPLVFFILLTSIFFYKTVLYGYIPLPGDSLVGGYEPYRSYSFLGYAPSGVPHKAQGPDVIRMLYPWKMFSVSQLLQKEVPLWNPYNFSGKPHMASLQGGVFYPLNILFMLGGFLGWSLYIMIQPILAGVFTYLFLREISIGKTAALFGGCIFAFCSFSVVWLEYGNLMHAFIWLPLILWLAHRFVRVPSFLLWICFVMALLFSFLAGYVQFTFYIYTFAGFFIGYHFILGKKKTGKKNYLLLFLGFFISVLLGSFQLFPMIELFSNSARTSYTLEQLSRYLLPIQSLAGVIFPDIFGNPASRNYWGGGTYIERVLFIGVIPFLFVLSTWQIKTSKYVKFFAVAAIISLVSTLDIFPIRFFHSLGLPFISTTVPSRIIGIYSFSLSVLAAIGMDYWIRNFDKRILVKISFSVVLVSIITVILGMLTQSTDHLRIMQRNMILPMAMLVASYIIFYCARIFSKNIVIYLLFILTIIDLFYFFQKITPFSPKDFTYPNTPVFNKLREMQGIDRSWGYGSAFIDTNFFTQEKLFTTDGYDPLIPEQYGEFIASSKNGTIPTSIPRSDVMIEQGYGGEDLEKNRYRKRVLDLSGVKYILNKKDHAFPKDRYRFVWSDEAYEIYENTDAIPRVFLASNYVIANSKNAVLEKLFNKQFDPKTTIVLEKKPDIEISSNSMIRNAYLSLYSPNKVVIETESDENTLLFLSDNYFSGWRVSIDSKDGTIYRANYTFRAVPLEKGQHQVMFYYQPESFRIGVYMSLAVVFFIALFSFFSKRYGVFNKT